MSHVYTPSTSNDPASYTMPDDGDDYDASSVNVPLEGIADKVHRLQSLISGVGVSNITVPIIHAKDVAATPRWLFDGFAGGGNYAWRQTNITDGGILIFDFPPGYVGLRCTSVNVYLEGNGGGSNHANVPANFPTAALMYQDFITEGSTPQTVASATDSAASAAAYDTVHALSIGVNHTINAQRVYWIRVIGESGANSVANALAVRGINITVAP